MSTECSPADLLRIDEVAKVMGVAVPTVRLYRRMGTAPLPAAGGGAGGERLLWRRHTVDEWVRTNRPPIPD